MPAELRVLGSLLEKQRTTPDVYPLTLNALRAACNQSTNRDPVVDYDEETIRDALHHLGRRRWTRLASGHGSRAAKYRHLLDEELQRRPRGAGGARRADAARRRRRPANCSRAPSGCTTSTAPAEMHEVLERLIERELVVRLERRPGQREERYAHLLGDDAEEAAADGGAPATPVGEDRLARLEREVAELRAEVAALREALGA